MTRNWNARWVIRQRRNDDRVTRVVVAFALLTVAVEISGLIGLW